MPEAKSQKENSLRLVAITGGTNVPSRRFRVKALVPHLDRYNIELDELCPRFSRYPPRAKLLRPAWFAAAATERLSFCWRAVGYDAVIIQRELISTLSTFESWLPTPRILDVDDAIYLRRGGYAAKKISSQCDLVICGNAYLANQFSQWNRKVAIIPTGVDTDLIQPDFRASKQSKPIIGWIGTSANYQYLETITPALEVVAKRYKDVQVQIISDSYPKFLSHLRDQLDYRRWKPGIEMELLPGFSIGLMPLADDEWSRGKCAFKMLQYMAAGAAVVASPVGMSGELLARSEIGHGPVTIDEWSGALISLLDDREVMEYLGRNGRQLVELDFSLSRIASLWNNELKGMN